MLAWDRYNNMAELNRLVINNWIFNGNTDLNKRLKKSTPIGFHSKEPHTITKLIYNINIGSTIAGSMTVVN